MLNITISVPTFHWNVWKFYIDWSVANLHYAQHYNHFSFAALAICKLSLVLFHFLSGSVRVNCLNLYLYFL